MICSFPQAWIIRDYPSGLMMAFIGCIIITPLSAGVALVAERGHTEAWTLKPDIELISIACTVSFTEMQSPNNHCHVNSDFSTLSCDFQVSLQLSVELQAVFGVGVRNIIVAWACKLKGPLFVSMFKPVGMIAASVMGVSLLGDTLYLGR